MFTYIYVIADVIVTCPPSTRISGPVEGGGGECSLPLSEPLTKGGEHEEVDLHSRRVIAGTLGVVWQALQAC